MVLHGIPIWHLKVLSGFTQLYPLSWFMWDVLPMESYICILTEGGGFEER